MVEGSTEAGGGVGVATGEGGDVEARLGGADYSLRDLGGGGWVDDGRWCYFVFEAQIIPV